VQAKDAPAATWQTLDLRTAATQPGAEVLNALGSADSGLDATEAAQRLRIAGPNVLRTHGTSGWRVLLNQVRNPLLPLLMIAALVSGFTGQTASAAIIVVIVVLSVGLGFLNEYRSEKAVEALHEQVRHTTTVVHGGAPGRIDVTQLVPGDVVLLSVGDVVPADLRLLLTDELTCDEAVLTGESLPASKRPDPVASPESPIELPSCVFMGTIVRSGTARAVVVRTGSHTEFGQIAMKLGDRHPETAFQRGLREFGKLLVRITVVLVVAIFVINLVIGRPFIDAVLFSLAVAVGLTPELLPAIVTISLASGAKRMAAKSVLVRRLVAIEDFGNIQVLFTDKTGTLTQGQITFQTAIDATGKPDDEAFLLGLLCSDVVMEAGVPTGGNALDQALWIDPQAAQAATSAWTRVAEAAFDFERTRISVLMDGPKGRVVITKGSPESVLDVCVNVPDDATTLLAKRFDAGDRVVALAVRDGTGMDEVSPKDETGLTLKGFLTFLDPPKPDAADSLARLATLGIDVKIVTGDNERVAQKVCNDLGLPAGEVVNGSSIDALSDEELRAKIPATTIFARVTPEQKSRIILQARAGGIDVGYMGDGVNDAVALHDADVGISVESAVDVAKDAADILLLKKDLGTLADGVVEGRRIFANTIKYILMATSSNFGNMFSAAGASAFLKFLPMLPTQILLNNLLYDASQTTIPTDNVDEEMLRRPATWDTHMIRRFMTFFGPISSVFDFATFGVMLWLFHAGESRFQTGWFVESLATQTMVIFVIRTRRVPFFKSRPSTTQLIATLSCAGIGVVLPYIPPLARLFGFEAMPASFLLIVVAFVVAYLTLAEIGKARFFRAPRPPVVEPLARSIPPEHRRVQRMASRWSHLRPVAKTPPVFS
jgi:Mg2+-importing ATPase